MDDFHPSLSRRVGMDVTLNTWKGDGLYNKRLALMARQLKILQPDIVCLQESLQSLDTELDTAATLARHLDMQCIFTPARKKYRLCEGKKLLCYSGLAVLTSFEVLDQQVISLPVDNNAPDRIAMNVLLNIHGTPWGITNLHLTHLQNRGQLRLQQLQATAEPPFSHCSTKPRIICGDFNCDREILEFKQWWNTSEYEIIDFYTIGKGELPGITFTASAQMERVNALILFWHCASRLLQFFSLKKRRLCWINRPKTDYFLRIILEFLLR